MNAFLENLKTNVNRGIAWLKQHPTILIWIGILAIGIYAQSIILGMCFSSRVLDVYSMEAIKEVLTTGTEVIAGLYGLTLTGYIFFLDRLQQKAEDDEMLEDIVALLKKRYHKMVLLLSAICFVVILLAFNFIIFNPESHLIPDYAYAFWGYETLLLVFVTLLFNIYFIIMVVDPDKIPRTSLQYKQKLSRSDMELGSLQEFLQDYEDIEDILKEKSESLAIAQIGVNPWSALKHLRGKELLKVRKWISAPLIKKMTKLGQYYNYMVFSQEMTVSKEMCELAKEIKSELSQLELK